MQMVDTQLHIPRTFEPHGQHRLEWGNDSLDVYCLLGEYQITITQMVDITQLHIPRTFEPHGQLGLEWGNDSLDV